MMEFILECFSGHKWNSQRPEGSHQFAIENCPQCKSIWSHVVEQVSPITFKQRVDFELRMAAKAGN
jgi:hypothetical protein